MATKTVVPKKIESVNIPAKLRKAFAWFESLAQGVKDSSLKERRQAERSKGAQLSNEKLSALADELEQIQRQLNPLEVRRDEIVGQILAHWGHTGITEIEGTLGRTLITTSFELAVDPGSIEKVVGDSMWRMLTARVLQAPLLLAKGAGIPQIREAIVKALTVRRLKVSVIAPSSRRPKSGETDEEAA